MVSWLSPKKKIIVSSVLYSLAGDDVARPNYLKSTLYSSLMMGGSRSTMEVINRSLLGGPGIAQRGFFNWSVRQDFPGLPVNSTRNILEVSREIVAPFIPIPPSPPSLETTVQSALGMEGDFTYFAERHVFENYYHLINEERNYEYDAATHEIIIQFESLLVVFDAADYDVNAQYIVAYFTQKDPADPLEPQQQVYIYEVGTGNATLDALIGPLNTAPNKEFFPYIPLRIRNKSIADTIYIDNGFYDECEAAFKKAFGRNNSITFSKLLETIEDNEDIAEIDYCYVIFGVPLNAKQQSSKRYIYSFFKFLIPYQNTTQSYMEDYLDNLQAWSLEKEAYAIWELAQNDSNDPLYGTPPPFVRIISEPKFTTLKLNATDPNTNSLDMRYIWINISEEFFTGLGKPEALSGEVWLEATSSEQGGFGGVEELYVYRQINKNSYSKLTVYGFMKLNYIYSDKYVLTTSSEAMENLEESELLIPMHNPTLKTMSLVDVTQLSIQNSFLLFNTYQIHKRKWYQTGIFKIIISIAVIIIAVILAPVTLGLSVGLLGTNLAVGTAIGLSGISAIIAGAVINSLAAVILTEIIMRGSTEIFGAKWGQLIGSIIAFVVFAGLTGGLTFANINSADQIMKLSDVLSNAYSGWVQTELVDINAKLGEKQEEYEASIKKINEMFRKLLGEKDLFFDPMQLTNVGEDSSNTTEYMPESLDQFIQRTTLVGSDIVEITLSLITDFAEINRALPEK